MKFASRAALTLGIVTSLAGFSASADSSALSGDGQVEARDPAKRIVTIDGRSYQVAPNARLRRWDGASFSLGELDLPVSPKENGEWPLYIGHYEAVESKSGLVLNELTLIERGE